MQDENLLTFSLRTIKNISYLSSTPPSISPSFLFCYPYTSSLSKPNGKIISLMKLINHIPLKHPFQLSTSIHAKDPLVSIQVLDLDYPLSSPSSSLSFSSSSSLSFSSSSSSSLSFLSSSFSSAYFFLASHNSSTMFLWAMAKHDESQKLSGSSSLFTKVTGKKTKSCEIKERSRRTYINKICRKNKQTDREK